MTLDQPWWSLEGVDMAQTLVGCVSSIRDNNQGRLVRYRVWDDLYDGTSPLSISSEEYNSVAQALGETTFNYAARALDFVHSKITTQVPTVRASGRGADHMQYLRARSLSRFIVGASDAVKLPNAITRAVHCCLRVGAAGIGVCFKDGVPEVEVVHPRELFVDPNDARHGSPRVMYRVRPTDKRSLVDEFPDRISDIASAGSNSSWGVNPTSDDWHNYDDSSDRCDRYEAWVLPSSPDEEDGLHVICVDSGAPLLVESWNFSRHPISIVRAWESTVATGFWGHGLLERLDSAQYQIDELVSHVGLSMRHANLKVFVNEETDIVEDGVLDDPTVGTIVKMRGNGVPTFLTPSVLGPGREVMSVIGEWRASLYQIAGIDESAVGSQRPAGVDSAIAMRTYHDFQSQVYVDVMKRIGQLAVDVIERLIDGASVAFGNGPDAIDWSVRYSKGGSSDEVSWSEVNMDRDSFVIELEEVSPVPDTFAGRLQEVEEDAAAGRIPPEYLTRLREDPDRWWMERCNAREDVDYVDWLVEKLTDPNADMPPLMDEMDMTMAIDRIRREVLSCIRSGRPQDVIDRLQGFSGRIVARIAPKPIQNAEQNILNQAPAGQMPAV